MISVIIPTHNRIKALQNCLVSLFTQTLQPNEIIVINDGSTDSTKKYLQDLGNKIRVITHEKNRGQSEARNSGIKEARGNILVFIDDDCIARFDWLENIQKYFNKTGADAVIGKTIYVAENYQGHFPEKIVGNNNGAWPGGGNIAYKKMVFDKIGFFNPLFDRYHNEDSELAIRAATANTKFVQAPEAVVYHQKNFWTVRSLLSSGKNTAVWVVLKKLYPRHYNYFGSPLKMGLIINPLDYLFIFCLPIILPLLSLRYLYNGQKDLKIFFAKWPLLLFYRRWLIYKEARRQKIFII